MNIARRSVVIASLVIGLVNVSCEGPTGAAGSPGPVGERGPSGADGPAGPPGASAGAGGQGGGGMGMGALPASCLQPCHGFDGVVEQWKTSTHFASYVFNLGGDEVPTWTGAGRSCGGCHASDAIEVRVAGALLAKGGATIANVTRGEINYFDPTAPGLAEGGYLGTSRVASVACLTCHASTPETDPHRTGQPYTSGAFPLRVPAGGDDEAFLEKSPTAGAVTGVGAGPRGPANACIWCHKSRKDVTNYVTETTKVSNVYWGPHEGPHADVYTGKGGYHFVGQTYGTSTHELNATCVDCHMTPVEANGSTADHSFDAKLSACKGCHVGATNFNVNGGQADVASGLAEMQQALNDAGYLTRASAPPFASLAADELGEDFASDLPRPNAGPDGTTTTLTADQAGALYNYFVVARGSALGVHNPTYTRQLLFDSFVALTGQSPTSIERP